MCYSTRCVVNIYIYIRYKSLMMTMIRYIANSTVRRKNYKILMLPIKLNEKKPTIIKIRLILFKLFIQLNNLFHRLQKKKKK